jgi:hypothetical protein
MVFENRVLWIIFGPKRAEVAGGWRRLHNEEPYNLDAVSCVTRVMKSGRMRWEGNVALIVETKNVYSVLVGKPAWKRPFGRLDVDRRIILEWISLLSNGYQGLFPRVKAAGA